MVEVKSDYLFEVSWEVCNKVGGIYTVVKSKAALLKEKYNNYFLVGPYFKEKAINEFVQENPPWELQEVFEELKNEGLICYYGYWQIKGEPKTILIDFNAFAERKNQIKEKLWENYKIDSLNSGWDFEEPMVWSAAVCRLLEIFSSKHSSKKIVAHFHEWLAGFGLLCLKMANANIATVFTTHATMLGRTIASAGERLYDMLENLDPEKEAYARGVQDKFTTERACAQNCDVFTTVSEITGMEAEKILGRKPDVLVLNGLDIERFPTFEVTSIKHRENREIIREFVTYHFFPHYYFDLENTLIFFIVGRYEYKNKGIDIFIRALAKLNDRMKEEGSKKSIVVFFWIPRDVQRVKDELSKNKINFDQFQHFVRKNSDKIQFRILDDIMKCSVDDLKQPEGLYKDGLFDKEFMIEAKRLKINFAKVGNPLLVTHDMPNEWNDAIIRGFVETGLDNKEDDKVKVVFYPVYLTGVDGLLDLPYYDAIMGCHLGLFPSYYEPWGYTPLEAAALGVPSLTTDFGGFGRFLMQKGVHDSGVFILKRFGKTDDEAVEHFTELMYKFTKLDEKRRVKEKMKAKELSNLADWKELVNNYYEAHNLAIEKKWGS
ncbi:glycosyltransferase [Candidatus Woesearchaeota archaeon]|nr:glycosyltransferase [Candidatus Woesearchaeota archaeon]